MAGEVVRMETVVAGPPTIAYGLSMNETMSYALRGGYDFTIIPPTPYKNADCPMGRNEAIKKDLDKPWDIWLWIDGDHVWTPDVIASLVDAIRRGGVDLITPLVPYKGGEKRSQPVAYKGFDEALGKWIAHLTGWEQPSIYEEAAIGTGFCAVRREVFEKMPRPWYERYPNPRQRDVFHGHDLYFAHKAKQAGFSVWLDSRVEVGHVAEEAVWVRRDFVESGKQKRELSKIAAEHPLEPSTKEPITDKDFWESFWQGDRWRWRENRVDVVQMVAPRIPENSNVLYWGCGDGSIGKVIEEMSPGSKVLGIDQAMTAISISRRRGLNSKLVRDLTDPDADLELPQMFDILLIVDWIERFPDPGQTLKQLMRYMRPEGQIMCVTPNLVLGPMDAQEHHHLIGEFNLGELLNRFGRCLEVEQFTEVIRDPEGKPVYEVPRLLARGTVEKAVPPLPAEEKPDATDGTA